jgi:hypothetical protein
MGKPHDLMTHMLELVRTSKPTYLALMTLKIKFNMLIMRGVKT